MIALTKSPPEASSTNSDSRALFAGVFLLLFWISYAALPWLTTPTAAGLTFSGIDFAEWSSLHPAIRAESPALLTSMLLRLPPVFALWIAALNATVFASGGMIRWLVLVAVTVSLVALMPPLEFFTAGWARNDPNYEQQFTMMIVAVIGSGIAASGLLTKFRAILLALIALAGLLTSIVGFQRTYGLIDEFGISAAFGPGLLFTCILFASVLIWGIWSLRSI